MPDPEQPKSQPATKRVFTSRAERASSILDGEWTELFVSFTGPDGTTEIGRMIYLACPLCSAVVAPDLPNLLGKVESNFKVEHIASHLEFSAVLDGLDEFVTGMRAEVQDLKDDLARIKAEIP